MLCLAEREFGMLGWMKGKKTITSAGYALLVCLLLAPAQLASTVPNAISAGPYMVKRLLPAELSKPYMLTGPRSSRNPEFIKQLERNLSRLGSSSSDIDRAASLCMAALQHPDYVAGTWVEVNVERAIDRYEWDNKISKNINNQNMKKCKNLIQLGGYVTRETQGLDNNYDSLVNLMQNSSSKSEEYYWSLLLLDVIERAPREVRDGSIFLRQDVYEERLRIVRNIVSRLYKSVLESDPVEARRTYFYAQNAYSWIEEIQEASRFDSARWDADAPRREARRREAEARNNAIVAGAVGLMTGRDFSTTYRELQQDPSGNLTRRNSEAERAAIEGAKAEAAYQQFKSRWVTGGSSSPAAKACGINRYRNSSGICVCTGPMTADGRCCPEAVRNDGSDRCG